MRSRTHALATTAGQTPLAQSAEEHGKLGHPQQLKIDYKDSLKGKP